jgi:hypothetical protein
LILVYFVKIFLNIKIEVFLGNGGLLVRPKMKRENFRSITEGYPVWEQLPEYRKLNILGGKAKIKAEKSEKKKKTKKKKK